MKLATLLLLVYYGGAQFFQQSLAQLLRKQKCDIDNRSSENQWESKLIDDLMNCGYSSFEPPPQNGTEPFEVGVFFVLKSFKFDSELQEFSAFTWTFFSWTDERLQWNPEEYGGVNKMVTSTIEVLWSPSLRLYNNIADEYDHRYLYIPCALSSGGAVDCVALATYETKCGTDLRDWPYDAQDCKLEFGLYTEKAFKMKIRDTRRTISMIGAEYGAEWDIMNFEESKSNSSEIQLTLKFRLERHGTVLSAVVVYPSLILSVLTFSSLFIDARLNLRLIVICFSLLCHNFFITDLSFEIPENTKDPPRLLMYYRGSLILTSFLLVLSFGLNAICRRNVACPNFITSINDFVFMKCLKSVVLPRWETNMIEDVDERNFVKDWTDIANIVNTVVIFISVIVYVCLYCVYMPHPIPYN